jgi:AraC-like DNA-binding protein
MEAILYIAIAQFIFGGLLSWSKPRKQLGDYLLTFWFLLMAIFMVLALFKNLWPDSNWAKLQLYPFFFTCGPFLYLYVRAITAVRPKLEFWDSLHLLPFVIFSVSAVTTNITMDENVLSGRAFDLENLVYSISSLVSISLYILLTFRMLSRHQANILEHFSYTSDRISLSWIRSVMAGFTMTMVLTVLAAMINVATSALTIHPGHFLFVGFAVFAFGFTYYGTRQPPIYSKSGDARFVDTLGEENIGIPVAIEAETEDSGEKYLRSSLTPETAKQYIASLQNYLEVEKPFLLRDLTLQDVAQALSVPAHHLTQAINEHLQKNFYTLVNEYRIEEVKRRLLDPKFAHLTMLSIAHDAGFNSKSSFNMTFKKHVGVTPSQFRNEA